MPRILLAALAALAAALAAALGGLAAWWLTPTPPVAPPAMALAAGLPLDHRVRGVALSPDGRALVYVGDIAGDPALYIRRFDDVEIVPRLLDGTAGARAPFFSPDGRWLGFFAGTTLRRVPVEGGPVETVCDAPADSAGGTWGADGRIVFAPLDGRGLVTVDASGGAPAVLTRLESSAGETAHGWPHRLPGDAGLVFTIASAGRDPRIAVLAPGEETPRRLLPITGQAQYISSGHLVYGYAGALMAVSFDLQTLEARGAPTTVASGLAGAALGFDALGASWFAASPGGAIAYLPGTLADPPTELVWVERDGRATRLTGTPALQYTPRLSPDGTRVATVARDGEFSRDVWLQDVAGGRRERITTAGSANHSPVWRPGGRELAFASNRDGPQNIYTQAVTPGGSARRLLVTDGTHTPASWRRGVLAFYDIGGATGRDVWVKEDGRDSRPIAASPASERSPTLSPDGLWVAYTSDGSGTDEIYVQPVAGGPARRVSAEGGTEPVWSADGHEIFYRRADAMLAVRVDPGPPLAAGPPSPLFERAHEHDPGDNLPAYDVAADGRFLMLRRTDPPADLRVLLNWTP